MNMIRHVFCFLGFVCILAVALVCGEPLFAQSMTVTSLQSEPSIRHQDRSPLDKTISLRLDSVTVQQAIEKIAREGRLRVSYKPAVLPKGRRVSLRANNMLVKEAFASVLRGLDFEIRAVDDSNLVLVKREGEQKATSSGVVQDRGIVRGRVVDSTTGKGIRGVTVTVDGTKLSTLTLENGTYTLSDVPAGTRTVFWRLVGYRSVTRSVMVTADKQATMNVAMSASATLLSGIVTSVTGTQQKRAIGTDVTTIDVPKVLQTAPISNVTDLLDTRVPGLTVIRSSGVPGAPSRLRLRGPSGGLLPNTPGAPNNDPIVIIDGIRINASQSGVTDQNLVGDSRFPPPSAIDQIDVNSIEKIDVYKGPSATAMYGSDAANGVIVITTKRGQAGPTRWSLTVNQDIEYLPGFYAPAGYYVFSSRSCLEAPCVDVDYFRPSGFGNNILIDSVVRFQALNESRLTNFGRGSGTAVTATVSGGSQTMTYSITGSSNRNVGLLKMPSLYQDYYRQLFDSSAPHWMRRPTVLQSQALNASFTINPRRDVRATFNARLTESKQRQSSAQLQLSDLASRYIDTTSVAEAELVKYVDRVDASRLVSDFVFQLDWNRWRFLPVTGTAGLSRESRDDLKRIPRGVPLGDFQKNVTKGLYANGAGVTTTQTGQVNGTVFPLAKISTAVGLQWTKRTSQSVIGTADSLIDGVSVPKALARAEQSHSHNVTGGWFIEPRLNLASRFFANPGFRFDGGGFSGFRSGWRGGFWSLFPKLNLSWIAVDRGEDTPLFGVFSMVRPRLAYGIAGVQPAPGWRLRLLSPPKYSAYSDISEDGMELQTLGNTQLRPERTQEVEFGSDFELWKTRATVTITQFVKIRTDAIVSFRTAGSVYGNGLAMYRNIGRVRNTGTEVAFSFIPIDHPMFSWTVNGSISKTTNTLVSLNNGEQSIDLGDGTRLVPGYPLFGRWERPILGYAQPSGGGHLTWSQVVVGDTAVYMGQQAPNFTLPLHMSVSTFKGLLTFDAGFKYEDGLTQINRGGKNVLANVFFNPASSLAEQAAALMANSNGQCRDKCTLYGVIQTVNTIRFNTVSVGYRVPRTFAQRLGVSTLSFALQGNNLGLWTNYRGKDPNVNSVTVGDVVMDDGQLPTPRTWRLQVRIGD